MSYSCKMKFADGGFTGGKNFNLEAALAANKQPIASTGYSQSHYDNFYYLTEEDKEEGKIRMDAYFVAKVWRTGSRDDSGALWHSLKTIARFGDKNDKEREIKALYNQSKALARIYNINLEVD